MLRLKHFFVSHSFVAVSLMAIASASDSILKEIEQATTEKDWSRVIILIKEHRDEVPDATRQLTFAYLASQRREEALVELNRLIYKTKRTDYVQLRNLASEQFLTDDTAALFQSGILQVKESKWEESKNTFQEAAKAEPNNALILRHLGHVLLHFDQHAAAAEKLRSSIRFNPSNKESSWLLGRAQWLIGEREEALKLLGNCLSDRTAPDIVWLWYLQALSSANKKETLNSALKIIKLDQHPLLFAAALENKWITIPEKKLKPRIEKALGQLEAMTEGLLKLNKNSNYLWAGFCSAETVRVQLQKAKPIAR